MYKLDAAKGYINVKVYGSTAPAFGGAVYVRNAAGSTGEPVGATEAASVTGEPVGATEAASVTGEPVGATEAASVTGKLAAANTIFMGGKDDYDLAQIRVL